MILLPTTPGKIEWTSVEAKALRDFLFSDVGQKMLLLCDVQAPTLLDGANVNKTLVSSGEFKGYRDLLEFIVSLTVESPTETNESASSEYPSIDDESKWEEPKPPTQD